MPRITKTKSRPSWEKTKTKEKEPVKKKEELEYEVLRITASKFISGKEYFKILWKGYKVSESTWEPIENLANCQLLLKDFRKISQTK